MPSPANQDPGSDIDEHHSTTISTSTPLDASLNTPSSPKRTTSFSSSLPFSMGSLRILLAFLVLVVALVAGASYSSYSSPPSTTCTPFDQPNPIASVYPMNATGLLNVTLAIIPIPLATARALIPPQWSILVHVYQALFQSLGVSEEVFPANHYPLLVQAGLDHDIQLAAYQLSIPDFQRAGYEFPFVDRLGDNYTSFRWVPHQIITASNADAVEGSRAYGTLVSPGESFDPPCDAYRWQGQYGGTTNFRAVAENHTSMSLSFYHTRQFGKPAFPLDLFRNMTNQPSFANGTACDNQIRLFNAAHFFGTSDTNLVAHSVKGSVRSANFAPLNGVHSWGKNVFGWQLATPFIENNYLDCDGFQGYSGVDLPGY